MIIDKATERRIWWKSAFSAGLKSLPAAAFVGIAAAAVMAFVALPLLATIAGGSATTSIMVGFLSLPEVAGTALASWLPTIPSTSSPFFPVALVIFNAAIGSIAAGIAGGKQGVERYHQQLHDAQRDARLQQLEAQVARTPEATVSPEQATAKSSESIRKILEAGPRKPAVAPAQNLERTV
jgi:hypothetical protein